MIIDIIIIIVTILLSDNWSMICFSRSKQIRAAITVFPDSSRCCFIIRACFVPYPRTTTTDQVIVEITTRDITIIKLLYGY